MEDAPPLQIEAPGVPQDGGDAIKRLRDLRPKNKVRKENPDDYFRRITTVTGTVVSAKNLDNTDTWGKSDPYCVVKGIRANNHLANVFVTRAIMNSLTPSWNEDFHFVCPESWGVVDLVGLKFLVYDADERYVSFMGSDDFLGGADMDLSELQSGNSTEFELELGGGPRRKSRLFKQRKPRLSVRVTVFHEWVLRPPEFHEQLLGSLESFSRVTELECHVADARNLMGPDVRGRGEAVCVVRTVDLKGSVRKIHRTTSASGSPDVAWHERFAITFDPSEEVRLLMFDVYNTGGAGSGAGEDAEAGVHLGTAWVPVMDFLETSKRRLDLLGESQLLERLLTPAGVPGGQEARAELLQGKTARPSSRSDGVLTRMAGGARAAWRAGGLKRLLGPAGRRTITVECSVNVETREMPYSVFLRKPYEIREEKDLEAVIPIFESSPTFPPPPEVKRFMRGERARPGLLTAKDRVVWISGVVHGASALSSMDAVGKSDPYCIVEGISNFGHRLFIHRTRTISNSLSPTWHETFYLAVPKDAGITKVMFSVYDSDEGQVQFDGSPEDDFLGNATVDLAYVLNGQRLYEDIPLVGARQRHKLGQRSAPGSFRRSPAISVEVRAQRRVQPVFEKYMSKALNWSPRDRHMTSRKPGSLGYSDVSQVDLERMPEAPRQVLHLHMTGRLGALNSRAHRGQWLEPPSLQEARGEGLRPAPAPARPAAQQSSEDDSDLRSELEHQRGEAEEVDEERMGAGRWAHPARSTSLPELRAALPGQRTATVLRQFAQGTEWLQGLTFRSDLEKMAGLLTHEMRQKPSHHTLTQVF